MRDLSAEDPQERMAKELGVTYVKLDGDIGILGNGAGLVMSTLDVVAQAGGKDPELAAAEAEIARLSEALKEMAVRLMLHEGKDRWG